ncbi:glycosyltransferase family 2 protein [Lyngbya confervoides]|uniref:Glycosyltransferase family 2 protein n=1 Tax=Lyngbya confervoides BDU141951 TaxID=1574623 RepID=A0ABD4T803_9CYAN|nr:glycosyltransferase family A protein [Lyngbya confervoides]MCM1984686.1 glycosyltransferase family 2 protein [Lyngbya confervoides BDU141951]
MTNLPLISTIMIFFNGERFMDAAIESVLGQTHENWELLLVDDGSTDGSTAMAQRYAQRYPERIRYLEHPQHQNRGMSATRNLGIQQSSGEYVAFLDADDVWLPHHLQHQLSILLRQPEAMAVFGPTLFWYSWDEDNPKPDVIRELGLRPDWLYQPPQLLPLLLQEKAQTPATCSILIRKTLFEKIGGFLEQFKGCYEDQAFFSKVYLQAAVYVDSECCDRYRQHSASHCAIAVQNGTYHRFRANAAHRAFLRWLTDYLIQQQVKDPQVWQALQRAKWPYRYPWLYQIWYPIKRTRDALRRRLARGFW